MKTKIILEWGANWYGKDDIKRSIDFARSMGALAKGQLWIADEFVNKKRNPKMHKAVKQYQLPREWVQEFQAPDVFYSVFDPDSLDWLKNCIEPHYYKVAALDSDQNWMLQAIASTNRKAFVSCGVYGLESVRNVVHQFYKHGDTRNLTLMHAVVDYPTKDALLGYFKDRVTATRSIGWGFSYNGCNPLIPAIAVALGAEWMEMHFRLDHIKDTPDAPHSFTKDTFKLAIEFIKQAEENMGNSERPLASELPHVKVGKRGEDGKR